MQTRNLKALAALVAVLTTSTAGFAIKHTLTDGDCTQPQTIYICKDFNWEAPCITYCLGDSENRSRLQWTEGGQGPWGDGNYTIGSWGPSSGVTTYFIDEEGNESDWSTYPGTADIDDGNGYWSDNVDAFFVFW